MLMFLILFSPSIKNWVDIKKFFNIENDKKIILAAMSSYDEILTTQILNLDKPEHHILKTKLNG